MLLFCPVLLYVLFCCFFLLPNFFSILLIKKKNLKYKYCPVSRKKQNTLKNRAFWRFWQRIWCLENEKSCSLQKQLYLSEEKLLGTSGSVITGPGLLSVPPGKHRPFTASRSLLPSLGYVWTSILSPSFLGHLFRCTNQDHLTPASQISYIFCSQGWKVKGPPNTIHITPVEQDIWVSFPS